MEAEEPQRKRRCSARLSSMPESKKPYYGSSPVKKDHSPVSKKKKKVTAKKNLPSSAEEEIRVNVPTVNLQPNGGLGSGTGSSDGGGSGPVNVEKAVVEVNNITNGQNGVVLADESGKSAYAKVTETLRLFNTHYLDFVQEEEKRCKKENDNHKSSKSSKSKERSAKRPDLKAITKMMATKSILYPEKTPGQLPGIDVGHQFYSRAEMVATGLHSHWLNGIDYMGVAYQKKNEMYKGYTFPIAVSIVVSGMYEDDKDDLVDLVYTGQGGNDLLGNKRQMKDQVMKGGNLALKNSMDHSVPIRVTRGHKCANSYTGKVYTYDGLYKVIRCRAEEGVSGFTVYRYYLRRFEDQADMTTNKEVRYCRREKPPKSISEVKGLVSNDISGKQEDIPIPATNLVDDPPVPPTGYTYCKSLQVSESVMLPMNAVGCNCQGLCTDPSICACARLNGSDFPYVHKDGGRLIRALPVVFECGPNCGCGPGCVNRTSQRGLKYHFEVFRTQKKGWAVKSWDFIPAGAPICEYTGRLMRTDDLDHHDLISENNFIFDIDCLQTMKGIDGRERRAGLEIPTGVHHAELDEKKLDSGPEYCIDAGSMGNVARFINHSCAPNLFVQCVLSSHRDLKLARIVLFAADNIPPLQELTYDYGYALDSVLGPDGQVKRMPCYCGAPDCRKRLY